jgi:hypothetical protein
MLNPRWCNVEPTRRTKLLNPRWCNVEPTLMQCWPHADAMLNPHAGPSCWTHTDAMLNPRWCNVEPTLMQCWTHTDAMLNPHAGPSCWTHAGPMQWPLKEVGARMRFPNAWLPWWVWHVHAYTTYAMTKIAYIRIDMHLHTKIATMLGRHSTSLWLLSLYYARTLTYACEASRPSWILVHQFVTSMWESGVYQASPLLISTFLYQWSTSGTATWCQYYVFRVGQNRIYTPYMTVYFVISLPKSPYIHRIYMVLVNPIYVVYALYCVLNVL